MLRQTILSIIFHLFFLKLENCLPWWGSRPDEAHPHGADGNGCYEREWKWPWASGGPSAQSGQVLRLHAGAAQDLAASHGQSARPLGQLLGGGCGAQFCWVDWVWYKLFWGAGIASSVARVPGSWWKGRGFESWQEGRENFLLQGQLSVLTPVFSIHSSPVKYPGNLTKSAGGWLQLNTPV